MEVDFVDPATINCPISEVTQIELLSSKMQPDRNVATLILTPVTERVLYDFFREHAEIALLQSTREELPCGRSKTIIILADQAAQILKETLVKIHFGKQPLN